MKRLRSTIGALVILFAAEPGAMACTLAHAIYKQPDTGYQLRFKPVGADADRTTSNDFVMIAPYQGGRLEGEVNWGVGASRPDADLSLGCPKNPTDAQIELCVYWRGLVYVLGNRTASFLPDEKADPPAALLFPDLSRRLWYSDMRVKPDFVAPDEVFTFSGCAK